MLPMPSPQPYMYVRTTRRVAETNRNHDIPYELSLVQNYMVAAEKYTSYHATILRNPSNPTSSKTKRIRRPQHIRRHLHNSPRKDL